MVMVQVYEIIMIYSLKSSDLDLKKHMSELIHRGIVYSKRAQLGAHKLDISHGVLGNELPKTQKHNEAHILPKYPKISQ